MAISVNLPKHTTVALQKINVGGFFVYNNGLFQKVYNRFGLRTTTIINVQSGNPADPDAFHSGLVVAPVDVAINVSYEEVSKDS